MSSSFALGCRTASEPSGSPGTPSPKTDASPLIASSLPRIGITWVDPPGLRRVPPTSPLQRARYAVPHAPGDTEDGELAVFHSGTGQRDSVDVDIDRWIKTFSGVASGDVKRADREANGLRLHTVEIRHGTFDPGQTSMGSSGPKKNYALEGASVEGPTGAYLFEMTGPAHTVAAGLPAFTQLLDSAHIVRADH